MLGSNLSEIENSWKDVCNLFEDALDNEVEVTLLKEEARSYIFVMSNLMAQYAALSLIGHFDVPGWLEEEYDNYSEVFHRIGMAQDTITLSVDDIRLQVEVLTEFISQLLPIFVAQNPDSDVLNYLNKRLKGETDE